MKLKLSAELMEVWKSYKMTSFSTFFKYKRICHRDVSLVKLKEDMCDTCIRYQTMLKDDSVDDADKEKIKQALEVQKKRN